MPWSAVVIQSAATEQILESLGHGHYRFVMRPGLDKADRRQLIGCLQDLRIDNVLANVVSMSQTEPPEADDDDD